VVTHGRTLYEGEARIPLLVHWPGRLKPRDVYEPVSHLDILPTLAELAGAKPHPAFQGSSLAEPARLSGKHPAIFMNIQGLVRAESVVCWPWKLIVEKNSRTIQLFDLRDDPEELCDLVEQEPGVAAVLAEVLRKQMKVQVEYHRKTSQIRTTHFSPRLMGCPQLPGRDEARRWDEL
jgi:choline-sulfatase